MADLWEKFVLAAAIGAVGTALAVPAGRICTEPTGRAMLEAALSEVVALADRRGVNLRPDCVAATLAFVESFPPDVTSSLQRDLEAHRPSEYDALPGAALRMASDCGMTMPTLEACEQLIRRRGLI